MSSGLVAGVHDLSEGGLGVALAEMAVRSGVGFRVVGPSDHVAVFAESPSRVVVCSEPDAAQEVFRVALAAGVPASFLGGAGGDRCGPSSPAVNVSALNSAALPVQVPVAAV